MLFYSYDLEKIVRANHPLLDVSRVVDFRYLAAEFWKVLKKMGRPGYGLDVGIKCLFLQFWYDLSDRELEERLRDDNGFRWFCGFELEDETPDHTYFTRIRTLLGAERIGKIFGMIMEKTEEKKILRKVFTFVDATAIKTKETTWAERDKAYCLKPAQEAMATKDCHSGAVLKNNMKGKNRDKDRQN